MTKTDRWMDVLSQDELSQLMELHDWRSWLSFATNWGLIFASFALVATVPHPLTILLALFVIGGRQLGLAVMMHDPVTKK